MKTHLFSSVQSLICVQLFATPWIAARQASLSITNSRSSLRLIHWVCDAIQPSHPLLLLPPIPPSIRVFSSESTLLMRWPKYWSFIFSIALSFQLLNYMFFHLDTLRSLESYLHNVIITQYANCLFVTTRNLLKTHCWLWYFTESWPQVSANEVYFSQIKNYPTVQIFISNASFKIKANMFSSL